MSYKVLQVNVVCGYGSTGRIAADLYKAIKKNGHDCIIAYGRGSSPEGLKTIKIGRNYDFFAHTAMSRITDKHGFYSRQATKELIKKVKEFDPDVIHLHNIHGYYVNIEILFNYLREAEKPVVWTLHDCWAFTGHCAHFDYIGCDKWKNLCHHCPQKNRYPKSIFLDNSKWNYKMKNELFTSVKNMTIVTPSQWLADLVKGSFLGHYPVKVINNGIDLEVFRPVDSDFRKRYNLGSKFLILGAAGVWDEHKGLKTFVEMSRELGSDYKIVLLGVSERQKRQLPGSILSIARTENVEELAQIYSAVDVFCNPTLEDNYPTVNMEALACGTPVVAYSTGGIPEQIGPGCGVVVKRGDVKGLMDAIRKIRRDGTGDGSVPHLGMDVSQARRAQNHDLSHFDKNKKYSEYIDLYSSLLK